MIKRSKKVAAIMSKLEDVKIELQEMLDNGREAYENKSDKWKESDKAADDETQLDALDDIINDLESAYNSLEDAIPE
jgi:CRISPR/Cas system-associated protein Cas5 (RAMP superfamily)